MWRRKYLGWSGPHEFMGVAIWKLSFKCWHCEFIKTTFHLRNLESPNYSYTIISKINSVSNFHLFFSLLNSSLLLSCLPFSAFLISSIIFICNFSSVFFSSHLFFSLLFSSAFFNFISTFLFLRFKFSLLLPTRLCTYASDPVASSKIILARPTIISIRIVYCLSSRDESANLFLAHIKSLHNATRRRRRRRQMPWSLCVLGRKTYNTPMFEHTQMLLPSATTNGRASSVSSSGRNNIPLIEFFPGDRPRRCSTCRCQQIAKLQGPKSTQHSSEMPCLGSLRRWSNSWTTFAPL